MRSAICLFLSLYLAASSFSQPLHIIPRPQLVKQGNGKFTLNTATVIVVKNGVDDNSANFLNSYLKLYYGFSLKKVKTAASNYIQLTTLQTLVPGKEGAYSLIVTPKKIAIQGQTASGTFYGMQTFIQLLPPQKQKLSRPAYTVSAIEINDAPRFAYRGMHLDVSRHFFPVSFIKKYIDYLALHKFNTFHWHLTDDQGWRIEIKKYPKLTSVGAWRNGTITGRYPGKGSDEIHYGGFYTQEEIKEVVKYATSRFIDVIPEIELPGHSSAAIAAYPELSCFPEKPTAIPANMISQRSVAEQKSGRVKLVQETWGVFDDVFCPGKENTFTFLQDVMDEVAALFPSKYVHAGGDECPKTHWKTCPQCQKRMKDNRLKDEHELQSYFIQRMEKYLNSKGKTLIGWDEILEGGLAPNAIVMSWRGEQGGIDAAKQKHNVIMTPGNPVYFDHTQSENEDSVTIGGFNPIEKVYAYEPIPKELNTDEAKYVLGAQANLWTEYIKNTRKVEYMIFPRMAALSEVLWSSPEKKDWSDFEKRLLVQFNRYKLWKANYSNAYFGLRSEIKPTEGYQGVLWKLSSTCQKCIINLEQFSEDSMAYALSKIEVTYDQPIWFQSFTEEKIIAHLINKQANKPDTISSVPLTLHFNIATGKKITLSSPASDKYPGDGAFTLVNGIQNEKGLARSKEFLGFSGTDCDAVIEMDGSQDISSVTIHVFQQKGSWIWPPLSMEVLASNDGMYFNSLGITKEVSAPQNGNGTMTVRFNTTPAKLVRVVIKSYGNVPENNPGAGNKAWLFVDEIEIN